MALLLLLLSIEVPAYSDFIADSVKKLHIIIYCGKCKILYYSTIYVQFFSSEWSGKFKKTFPRFLPHFHTYYTTTYSYNAGGNHLQVGSYRHNNTQLYYHFDKSTLFGQILVECYFLVASLVDALVQVVLLECIPPQGVFQVWWWWYQWSLKMVVSYRHRFGCHLKFLHFGRRVEQ